MNEVYLIEILKMSFGLSLLWILIFWLAPDYRVDSIRQRLFAIRDSLFDEAATGKIPFSHPAYIMLRGHINGFIRVAHRLNLFVVVLAFLVPSFRRYARRCNFYRDLSTASSDLSQEAKRTIEAARVAVAYAMLDYVFWGLFTPLRKLVSDNKHSSDLGKQETRVIRVIETEARSIDLVEREACAATADV